MEADTPSGEPAELSIESAGAVFANLFSDEPPKEEAKAEEKTEEKEPEPEKVPESEENAQEEGDDAPVTVEVDGKQVTLTKAQIAEAYKSGLRQSDYTKKTTEAAEHRKAADAEIQKAQTERRDYADKLQKFTAQLEGAIEQQDKTDWQALLKSDPIEYLNQRQLYEQRQAALKKGQDELATIAQRNQAENAAAYKSHLARQQDELLAKLPEWKDEAKARTERDAIRTYLKEQGYSHEDVEGISDHRAVILGRKAMLYDQMMAKASAAAKLVHKAPAKVEKPGTTSDADPTDGRTRAMRQLQKTGSVEDAAKVFAAIL